MPIVYKITNTVTNKLYIGWTSKTLDLRWNSHLKSALKNIDNRKFYNAIRKYGSDCWTKEILLEVDSIEAAKEKEIELIALHDSYNNGYNATKGGDGNNGIKMSEESNQKRSIALKGKSKSEETIKKFRERKSTPEENKKRSLSHKGKSKPWVKWTKDQITKRAMSRRSLTEEQYSNMHLLRNQGYLIKEIAGKLDLSTDIVKKWLKKDWIL